MSKLPIEIQLDSLDEEDKKKSYPSWKDRDDFDNGDYDPYQTWVRLLNPRADAFASTLEQLEEIGNDYLEFLGLDQDDLPWIPQPR